MNKTEKSAAEWAEGRALTKRNSQHDAGARAQNRISTTSRLLAVRNAAKKDKARQFTSLMHHLTIDLLEQSFRALSHQAAAGADGVTWAEYETQLRDNLERLHHRVQDGTYRPQPARRVLIPKEDGSERPLNILCLEDKIVQQAVVTVLNAIYETDFLGFSYGFRPGRGPHDALDALIVGIERKPVNWVLDMDIRKFFDTVKQGWLLRFLQHRIQDRRLLRLLRQWLKAGVLDEHGHRVLGTIGTPQGAVVSPLMANVYLHYVFDLWVQQWRKRQARGIIVVVRYADDVVVGFQNPDDAARFRREVAERFQAFGLALHPDKTRLIRFGRFAHAQNRKQGLGKPETFNFLGFTHICGVSRQGRFLIYRKTRRDRLQAKLKAISQELKKRLHHTIRTTGHWLRSVVQGHLNYYGVPLNGAALSLFCYEVRSRWYRALCRRSQRKRLNWKRFGTIADHWIPKATIVHPYPYKRFDAKYSR